jgi:trk system potassium uptake protein TrkH
MRQQIVIQDVLDQDTLADARQLITFIISMTLIFELAGTLALLVAWYGRWEGMAFTLYCALFHAISAFCNAGFSLFSDSLMGFADAPLTHGIIAVLIIAGGLGFMVIRDLYHNVRNRFTAKRRRIFRLRIQTKIVLMMSLVLILSGAFLIYVVEQQQAFASYSSRGKLWISFFQSVTTRTAGFNSCDIARLSSATLFAMVLLMFVGASPGSTGGGIKTTTIAVLWTTAISTFRQRQHVEIMRRTIPQETIRKALTLLLFSMVFVLVFTGLLLYIEKKPLTDTLFEAVSAFGTVGLSTGITPTLSIQGKILITLLMFVGRLGPLTLGYAFVTHKRRTRYVYPDERVMIG